MNHKFKSNRRGHTHFHAVPVMVTLEGHYVPQPTHVDIPEYKPMPVHTKKQAPTWGRLSDEERLWNFSTRVFGRDNDPRYRR